MENTAHTTAHSHGTEPSFSTKTIWRTFWVLLIITCIELIIGMFIAPHFHPYKHWFNVLYMILTLTKAFYIVAEFMHLRHEIKNLIMTIVVPLMLFVWFVLAFLWDGDAYRDARNRYDPYKKEQSHVKAPGEEHGQEAKTPGIE